MLPRQQHPLSERELVRLEQFLQTPSCGEGAMGLSYAHGFLTATVSGPEQLEPHEWLGLMFDDPVFDSGDQAEELLCLAMRLFRHIERGLNGEQPFLPVLDFIRDQNGQTHTDAQPWCRGFSSGLSLFSERWTAHAHGSLRAPIRLILQLAEMRGIPDPAYGQLCDALPGAAELVYRYWRHQDP